MAAATMSASPNPAIDKLIETIIFAPDRAGLVTACKALDRALIWNHYVVPMWYINYERTARWDRFGRPDKLPDLQRRLSQHLVVGRGEGQEGGGQVRRLLAAAGLCPAASAPRPWPRRATASRSSAISSIPPISSTSTT